jgi:hypothetical protein
MTTQRLRRIEPLKAREGRVQNAFDHDNVNENSSKCVKYN